MDFSGFPDTSIFDVPDTDTLSAGAEGTTPGIGPAPPPTGTLPTLEGLVPGLSTVIDLLQVIDHLPNALNDAVNVGLKSHPLDIMHRLAEYIDQVPRLFNRELIGSYQFIQKWVAGTFYREMLKEGLGVDVDKFDTDAMAGVNTIDDLLGFTMILPYVIGLIDTAGKALLGERWGERLTEALAKLPEEMGLSWAMGLTIEKAFEASVGRSVEEGINLQKRGNRIEWPQLRILLKQHILKNDEFILLLKKAGFPDEQITWLSQLSDVVIPVGDIQQLYLHDQINADDALTMIEVLGFSPEQAKLLRTLYIDKAETEASAMLRTTARSLYTEQLITEDAYRTILTDVNYPKRQIDDDIHAINLVHSTGRVLQSVGVIKTRFQHNTISRDEAAHELAELNYAPSYIEELLTTWGLPPLSRTHGLSEARVLSYYISGLLSRDAARAALLARGLNTTSTDFLLDHPSAANGAHVVRVTPSIVVQAYIEGAISYADLSAALQKAGVRPQDEKYWLDHALHKAEHTKGSHEYTATLTVGDIREAFKYGIYDLQTAMAALHQLGYSPDSATLILEIVNKGVFQPAVPPIFNTLQEAIEFLQSEGYTLTPPADPRLIAAEGMLAAAGYSWTPPTGPGRPPPP